MKDESGTRFWCRVCHFLEFGEALNGGSEKLKDGVVQMVKNMEC